MQKIISFTQPIHYIAQQCVSDKKTEVADLDSYDRKKFIAAYMEKFAKDKSLVDFMIDSIAENGDDFIQSVFMYFATKNDESNAGQLLDDLESALFAFLAHRIQMDLDFAERDSDQSELDEWRSDDYQQRCRDYKAEF